MLFPEAKKLTRHKISTFQQCLRKLLFSASHDLILAPQIKSTTKNGTNKQQPNLFNNIPVSAPTLVASLVGKHGTTTATTARFFGH